MRHITKRPHTTRTVRLLAALAAVGALTLAGCGGGSDDTSTSITASGDAGSSATSSGSSNGGGGSASGDIASKLSNDPVDSKQITEGGLTVLAASFCGSQVGDGVEILATGFSSGDVIDAEVNGSSTQLVPTQPELLQQILTTSSESYTVEVFLPDGSDVTFELTGCD
jgi:hypothetical protein